jgi:hypothetical protein
MFEKVHSFKILDQEIYSEIMIAKEEKQSKAYT